MINVNSLFFNFSFCFLRILYVQHHFLFTPYKSSHLYLLGLFGMYDPIFHWLLLRTYTYRYIHYISKHGNTTCSVCMMLLVCVLSELTIEYWITSWYAPAWGRQSPPALGIPLLPVVLCVGTKPLLLKTKSFMSRQIS